MRVGAATAAAFRRWRYHDAISNHEGGKTMRRNTLVLGILLSLAAAGGAGAEVTAGEAFETLKGMAGTWRGTPEGSGDEAEAEAEAVSETVHEIEVSAAGTVVMETMAPGTAYEMINMYHLDGDDLVLTHYCAGGNQPRMRLDRAGSTVRRLIFEFDGGTNLDPATDHYIRSAELTLSEDGRLESAWTSWGAGEPAGGMTFHLARSE